MLTLQAVLGASGLGLRLISGGRSDNVTVRWAHVSELDDPTPWLEGGEFLLTTGLSANWTKTGALHYCKRLVDCGVVALGVSVGPELHYQKIPENLAEATKQTGLRLVHIPQSTPLQAIVRAVADLIAEADAQPLRSLLDAQQRLISQAATGGGLSGALEHLRRTANLRVAIIDIRLQVVAKPKNTAFVLSDELRRYFRKQLLQDAQGAISFEDRTRSHLLAFPLVLENRVRGYEIVQQENALTLVERNLLKAAAPVLALLLEIQETAQMPKRRARQRALRALLSGDHSPESMENVLASAGISLNTIRVIRARTRSISEARAFTAALMELGRDVIVRNEDDQQIAIVCDPIKDFVESIRGFANELGMSEIGVSEEKLSMHASDAANEAIRAQNYARIQCVPVATAPAHGGQLISIFSTEQEGLVDIVSSVLHPIELYDKQNPRHELLAALQAYFASIASIEAAATKMSIHRHTMRSRLQKISEISGYDLNEPEQYLELWLALRLRETFRK